MSSPWGDSSVHNSHLHSLKKKASRIVCFSCYLPFPQETGSAGPIFHYGLFKNNNINKKHCTVLPTCDNKVKRKGQFVKYDGCKFCDPLEILVVHWFPIMSFLVLSMMVKKPTSSIFVSAIIIDSCSVLLFYVSPLTLHWWWHTRQVSIEEGEAKGRDLGVMFIETSAKAGFNIKVDIELFVLRMDLY